MEKQIRQVQQRVTRTFGKTVNEAVEDQFIEMIESYNRDNPKARTKLRILETHGVGIKDTHFTVEIEAESDRACGSFMFDLGRQWTKMFV